MLSFPPVYAVHKTRQVDKAQLFFGGERKWSIFLYAFWDMARGTLGSVHQSLDAILIYNKERFVIH